MYNPPTSPYRRPFLHQSCFWLCLPACVLKQFVNI
ncbi:unnamed protein product, partial [Ectocarpus sp. 12 AP-2014]